VVHAAQIGRLWLISSSGTAGKVPVDRSLGHYLTDHHTFEIDVGLIVVLFATCLYWFRRRDTDGEVPDPRVDGMRRASTGIVTAVSFLVPLTLLSVQYIGASPLIRQSGFSPRVATVDLFVATVWLAVSFVAGIVLVALAALARPTRRGSRAIYVAFVTQLVFVVAGIVRLVIGLWELTTFILRKTG
jgi:hypothetical protein